MSSTPNSGVLQRALDNLRNAWRAISQTARTGPPTLREDLPEGDVETLRMQMRECLDSKGGEVSARARAAGLGHSYLNLNDRGRKRFLQVLAEDFGVDWSEVYAATRNLRETYPPDRAQAVEDRLREALTPGRLKLLTQFNSLPEGVKFLVDLRADLFRYSRDDTRLQGLEKDLLGLLVSWFDVGFLDLRRLTWDSPAAVLEKLIAYEAVHEIRSWDDLKNRLAQDRRCYAFFHPRMPDEPLIFLQVALGSGTSGNVQELLDQNIAHQDPQTADTAVFYSISNTQEGLKGVSFGSFLIKRVVDRIAQELPGIRAFVTLSPVPGFRKYLETRLAEPAGPPENDPLGALVESGGGREQLRSALSSPQWYEDPRLVQRLKKPLIRACAHYLVRETVHGRVLDSVAHFHFTNGAFVERINWLGDVSEKGIRQSLGLMANYCYNLPDIEANHEDYRASATVAASPAIMALLAASK